MSNETSKLWAKREIFKLLIFLPVEQTSLRARQSSSSSSSSRISMIFHCVAVFRFNQRGTWLKHFSTLQIEMRNVRESSVTSDWRFFISRERDDDDTSKTIFYLLLLFFSFFSVLFFFPTMTKFCQHHPGIFYAKTIERVLRNVSWVSRFNSQLMEIKTIKLHFLCHEQLTMLFFPSFPCQPFQQFYWWLFSGSEHRW